MGNLDPKQNFDHLLDVVSGYDGMHDLQFAAKPKFLGDNAAGVAADEFERGSLVSLDTNGEWVPGLSTAAAMPCWAINATGDFDVNSDIGNVSGGVVAAYVATGGYELKTTEFNTNSDYAPNDFIGADATTAGLVDLAGAAGPTAPATSVVGVVSKGEVTEVYNQDTLQFWPVFLPARA